jgi:hypothetical protein
VWTADSSALEPTHTVIDVWRCYELAIEEFEGENVQCCTIQLFGRQLVSIHRCHQLQVRALPFTLNCDGTLWQERCVAQLSVVMIAVSHDCECRNFLAQSSSVIKEIFPDIYRSATEYKGLDLLMDADNNVANCTSTFLVASAFHWDRDRYLTSHVTTKEASTVLFPLRGLSLQVFPGDLLFMQADEWHAGGQENMTGLRNGVVAYQSETVMRVS